MILALLLLAQGDAQVSGSGIVIRTTVRLAGAIDSLTWGGKEFIDSFDHGRQLQSACAFGDGQPGFHAEGYNPTEAGSRRDGAGATSTSELLSLKAERNVLETRTRMAFWLRPGESSEGKPARNAKTLSDVILTKKVRIDGNLLDYRVTFTVPEAHPYGQYEALTGYMPAAFSRFLVFDQGETKPLSDGPGEQARPVILSTESGSHAMGIWSPDPAPGYGRWRFAAEKVVKWNCVFRERDVKPGDKSFRCVVAVGTLADVTAVLKRLKG
ncbi:MAG TPA: hypothetical protein VF950_01135 [Planctomycetota bacterium]